METYACNFGMGGDGKEFDIGAGGENDTPILKSLSI
jgi:hypothetical protein